METIIYGASDDLLEISGAFSEEIPTSFDDEEEFYVAVSDGTLLSCIYDGEWKFRTMVKGSGFKELIQSVGEESKHEGYENYSSYSDLVIFSGEIKWVLYGNRVVTFKKPAK